jgi:hypothetical protein
VDKRADKRADKKRRGGGGGGGGGGGRGGMRDGGDDGIGGGLCVCVCGGGRVCGVLRNVKCTPASTMHCTKVVSRRVAQRIESVV